VKWSDWDITYTRKGLIKARFQTAVKYLTFAAAIAGTYWARQNRLGLKDLRGALRRVLEMGVSLNSRLLEQIRQML